MSDGDSLFTALRNELTGSQWQALVKLILWADETDKENVEIPVADLARRFDDESVYWLDILRALNDRRAGELKLGRRNFPTRFKWNSSLGELAAALRGDEASISFRQRANSTLRLTLGGNREIVVTLPESVAPEEVDLATKWFALALKSVSGV